MELRHLRYFVAVAEALSFTRAAEKLRLAQPSLTRQVRNLEDEIGVKLLDRSNNRVSLTDEGRQFLFDAKKLLAMSAESIATVQRMNRGQSADLNIGYVANIHYGLLPATLGAFRKLCPGVALNLFDMTSAEQFLALDARKIDLGFVGIRPVRSGHHLLSECVAYDAMLVALPISHPLAKRARSGFPTWHRNSSSACPRRPIPARANGSWKPLGTRRIRRPDFAGSRQRADGYPVCCRWSRRGAPARAGHGPAARGRHLSSPLTPASAGIDHRVARR